MSLSRQFWIVTPAFRGISWLPCAVASVADQTGPGIKVHHHVQDGGSDDGTREWLEHYEADCLQNPRPGYSFSFESASDKGMYDAINKGWNRAPHTVDFLGHLNSDEQYLAGAFAAIAQAFERHPQWEAILADMIVVDPMGRYLCHRRSLKPYRQILRYTTGGMTAATFQRASVFQRRGISFSTDWRIIADKVWYNDMIQAGVAMGCCNQLVSIFTETGKNLGWSAEVKNESQRYAERFLIGGMALVYLISKWNAVRRFFKELWLPSPENYSIYTRESLASRQQFTISKPTVVWGKTISQT